MKKILFYLLITIIAATPAFALDTIVFKNGDTLTGTILKQDPEHVAFKSESFGSVSLLTRDIAEIRIGVEDLVEVEVPSKIVVVPEPAKPAPKPAAPHPPAAAPKKKSKWTGQAGLSIAMRDKTNSNKSGTYKQESFESYRIYGNLNWKGIKNGLRWNWTYRYSADETRVRDDYFNVTQKYTHNLKNGYYGESKTLYQRDYNRDIENEYLQTAEIGKKWFQRPKFKFSTSIGAGYHYYERSKITIGNPEFIFDESLRWQLINSLTLFQKYTHLGDLEKYQFVFSGGLENKLIRDLFLRLEYRLDRDTDTSYDDRAFYDRALLTSLLYKF